MELKSATKTLKIINMNTTLNPLLFKILISFFYTTNKGVKMNVGTFKFIVVLKQLSLKVVYLG